jgi:N-acetylmuramoyl-L-alanine amidase
MGRRLRGRLVALLLATLLPLGADGSTPAQTDGSEPAQEDGSDLAHEDRFDCVVLDPGHGGDDHGAAGANGLLEKNLVLDVARRVATRLREGGLRVVTTRSEDRAVGLDERSSIANDARGDLFVSIHANAASSGRARGIETYFASLEASDADAGRLAALENEAFGAAGLGPATDGDPLAAILGDMMATEHLRDSQEFARLALKGLAGGERSRGVKQAPFVVLMGVRMPAALVEVGFVTNAEEARTLSAEQQRERIAEALAEAVREFGRRYDARRGLAGSAVGGEG